MELLSLLLLFNFYQLCSGSPAAAITVAATDAATDAATAAAAAAPSSPINILVYLTLTCTI
jgi:hypothetical protein